MLSKDAIKKIVDLILKHVYIDEAKARGLAEKIYADVMAPALEDERNDWINLSKYPDNLN